MLVAEAPAHRRRPPRTHRSWRQRAAIVAGAGLATLLLLAAAGAWYVDRWYAGIDRVTIVHASPTIAPGGGGAPGAAAPGVAGTPTTEPYLGPSNAMNVLLTGSDGRSCVDPDSPYAGAFLGSGNNTGDRSDTILLLRVDPAADSVALLSFPRDLWVPIAGGTQRARINSAFRAEDPNPLIQTIESTFGLRIDHYVGVDFCAFKAIVDATGGISIPFESPVRDLHTGLAVPEAGCHAMSGDEALAYVRSRYYEYQDERGRWVDDGSSDYGRMARQQDFIRRLAARALDKGATNPLTAKRLLDVAHDNNVRIDDGLSLNDLVRLARAIRDVGPENAASYRVEGKGQVIGGASVIVPDLTSDASTAILAIFRGQQPAPTSAATAAPKSSASTSAGSAASAAAAAAEPTEPTTAPTNMRGVFPPADTSCH